MTEATSQAKIKLKHKARASIALLILAVISITTATYAWFTITNTASVNEMELTVTTGTLLKVNTVFSTNITDYKPAIDNTMVNAQLLKNAYTVNKLADLRLLPLTSGNALKLYSFNRNSVTNDAGIEPSDGGYLNLDLWFMASVDMDLYLNGQETTAGKKDNTYINPVDGANTTAQKAVVNCVRVGFTPYYHGNADGSNQTVGNAAADYNAKGKAVVYEPNKPTDAVVLTGNALKDSGAEYGTGIGTKQQTFNKLGTNGGIGKDADKTQTILKLKAGVPAKVVMRIWIEGEDPQCVNGNGDAANQGINIEQAKFVANFRFTGAKADGTMVD